MCRYRKKEQKKTYCKKKKKKTPPISLSLSLSLFLPHLLISIFSPSPYLSFPLPRRNRAKKTKTHLANKVNTKKKKRYRDEAEETENDPWRREANQMNKFRTKKLSNNFSRVERKRERDVGVHLSIASSSSSCATAGIGLEELGRPRAAKHAVQGLAQPRRGLGRGPDEEREKARREAVPEHRLGEEADGADVDPAGEGLACYFVVREGGGFEEKRVSFSVA